MKKIFLIGALLIAPFFATLFGQSNSYSPGRIKQKLNKLNVLGSVLYVAAHPDDENTRLITYYANDQLMRTAYLSATRGDGGQNLIGPEIREGLGVIRTQELLAARRTDGGQQFFSRANDFGYSKNPDETFTIWDRDQVLADFVWVFRKFRPDIVITRFGTDPPNHGHHTASAILAQEAFKLAGDPEAFPEQLGYVDPWEPKKIFWNTGWWWFRRSGADTTGLTTIDMGSYNALLGESYGEIAAKSRSMHKSQGFGSSGSRSSQIEYLAQWEGTKTKTPFDDIVTSWDRVEGSEETAFFIEKAVEEFDMEKPWEIAPSLVSARKALNAVQDEFWREIKRKEIDELLMDISGLYLGLSANTDYYAPSDSIQVKLEAVNRSNLDIKLSKVSFSSWSSTAEFGASLTINRPFISEMNFKVPLEEPFATPYWLREPSSLGMYTVKDQLKIGQPENDPPFTGTFSLDISGETIAMEVPIYFKRTDPVKGEVIKPVTVGPPVTMNINATVLVFGDNAPKPVEIRVVAGRDNLAGELSLELPAGWQANPSNVDFSLERKGQEKVYTFQVMPPKRASEGKLKVSASLGDQLITKGQVIIDYDHIPTQTVYPESEVKLVKLDLKKKGDLIGYIEGAGDAIPENLEQVGYKVERLEKDDVELENLGKYDAIVLGVRAFNTVDWLSYKNEILFEYVKNGGTLVAQYNTNRRLVTEKVAPFDLTISRDRVTVEQAPVSILLPNHEIMQSPNKISEKDFEGWVQERGLYFPNKWSDQFEPVLSSNDPKENPTNGGLLVAKYGKGHYVYSGYSWFRELPAGVSGAYRIFVNMISLGND